MEIKDYYYEEDLSKLRIESNDLGDKIRIIKAERESDFYDKLNKTQQYFYDKYLDSITQQKHWLDSRIEHVRLMRNKK
ncbi:MAG: hypothetical protein RR744_00315 [Cellulosilyticaceae bacterium]